MNATGVVSRITRGTRLIHVTTIPMSLIFLRGQVGYMKDRGFEVHALASPGVELDAFGESEGVTVHAVDMRRRVTPLRDVVALFRIVLVLRQVRPTIVHAHTPKAGLLAMIAAWLTRSPVRIYHMRGLPVLGATGLRKAMLRWTERVACHLAHRVICVSQSVRMEALRLELCAPDRIKVLAGGSGNGVDAGHRFNPAAVGIEARHGVRNRLGIPTDAIVIGFIGRIVRDKGIVELAEAWRQLRDDHPRLHLLLVGPFEPQDPVPAATEALLRSDPRVHLTGPDWDTPPLYAAMDIVALPSYREGLPNVPLEAAAMGLPVIASAVPGCVDAVRHGVTGILVPVRDATAVAAAARSYLGDPGLCRAHGRAGRVWVLGRFRQELIWESLLREYSKLLGASRSSRQVEAAAEAVG